MVVKSISYSESFEMVTSFGLKWWEKIGAEAELSDGDNIQDCLAVLKGHTDLFHKTSVEQLQQSEKKSLAKVSTSETDKEIDKLFNKVKTKLSKFQYQDDAHAYLETTEWKHNLELKSIITSLPKKS